MSRLKFHFTMSNRYDIVKLTPEIIDGPLYMLKKNIFISGTGRLLTLICGVDCVSPSKFVQMMSLG